MAKDSVAAYVDNLFTEAEMGHRAAHMMSILESALRQIWSAAIKDGSRECITSDPTY